ncbi:MAG: hypothetical protein AAGL96_14560 [Pseudomonadota bacterium]
MNLAFHAKAIVAFCVALLAPAFLLLLLGDPTFWHVLGALLIGGFTATLTALAVWFTPNRTHGFNVNLLATAMTDAGFGAAKTHEESVDDQTHESRPPGEDRRQSDQARWRH